MCRLFKLHRWKHPAHNREQRSCHIQSEGSIKRPPVCPCIAGIGEHISLRAERHLWKTDYCDAGTFFIGNEPCTDQTVSYKVPGHKGEWQNRGISGKNKSCRGRRDHCLCDRQSGKTKQWGFFCTGVQKNFRNHRKNNKKSYFPDRNRYGKCADAHDGSSRKNPGSRLHFWSRTAAKDNKK